MQSSVSVCLVFRSVVCVACFGVTFRATVLPHNIYVLLFLFFVCPVFLAPSQFLLRLILLLLSERIRLDSILCLFADIIYRFSCAGGVFRCKCSIVSDNFEQTDTHTKLLDVYACGLRIVASVRINYLFYNYITYWIQHEYISSMKRNNKFIIIHN